VCFRNIFGQVSDPSRVEGIKMSYRASSPDCNDMHVPGMLWQRDFLIGPGLRGIIVEVSKRECIQFAANVGIGYKEF